MGPNPQPPIPNPQSPIPIFYEFKLKLVKIINFNIKSYLIKKI